MRMEPSEKVAIGEELWPKEKEAAEEREKAGLKKGTKSPAPVNNRNGDYGDTRDKVAKVHSFYAVPLVPFPTCFCLSGKW